MNYRRLCDDNRRQIVSIRALTNLRRPTAGSLKCLEWFEWTPLCFGHIEKSCTVWDSGVLEKVSVLRMQPADLFLTRQSLCSSGWLGILNVDIHRQNSLGENWGRVHKNTSQRGNYNVVRRHIDEKTSFSLTDAIGLRTSQSCICQWW